VRAEGWSELFRGGNAARGAVLAGGMTMHAINTFIVVTILPTVVRDIGGLPFFAWSTTLYVVASLFGGACCSRVLARLGARGAYRLALAVFALGCVVCATAPSMPVLLAGRLLQGFGAGTLSALSFTMVRLLFPETLWSRALAVISAAWGVATLLGPALGGMFAQYTGWRFAFWALFALSPCLLVLVERTLPRDLPRQPAPRTRLAMINLLVLAGAVLSVSAASMFNGPRAGALGLLIASSGLFLFVRLEAGGGPRLLPRTACNPLRPLGATYAAMVLLLIGICTEIFVPYFLQVLHGLAPLNAGYLSALMAGGWTSGSIVSAGLPAPAARIALLCGPAALALGLLGLFVLMPVPGGDLGTIAAMGCALAGMGIGIGLCWPNLGARVFSAAMEGEKELAAASMTVVIMVGNAFGSALGGMVTNLAGLTRPGGSAGASSAASWLFGCFIVAPALAALIIRRFRALAPPVVV
jgi:predicted MFS family arabinose efflux permease